MRPADRRARTSSRVLASGATVTRAFTYARRAAKDEVVVRQLALDLGMQLEVRLDDGSEEFDRDYRQRFPE